MLYVFNSANRVQIAWNSVLPAQKKTSKDRASFATRFVRTVSAG